MGRFFPQSVIPFLALFIGVGFSPATGSAVCDYQQDGPDCFCFNDTGTWNAGASYPAVSIQSVALSTLGTISSCCAEVSAAGHCPADHSDCYYHSGKPYYQMVLGMNSAFQAFNASFLLSALDPSPFARRMAWCSETIAYWHREAGIPYPLGYRNDYYHQHWQRYNVLQLREWYELEEATGGRGRWIQAEEIDYRAAEPGLTIPTPGAYMAYSRYLPYAGMNGKGIWSENINKYGHSLLVDEVWIHRDALGMVFRVEASFLEGNSSSQVKNDRPLLDIFSFTPMGSQWFSSSRGDDRVAGTADDYGKKIYGFGIDLDEAGNPIYDSSRLHFVDHPFIRAPPQRLLVSFADPAWEAFSAPIWDRLKMYAHALRQNGGPNLVSQDVQFTAIANGHDVAWTFPAGLGDRDVTLTIDFLNPNPIAVTGLTMFWHPAFIPNGYFVQFGDHNQVYRNAEVQDVSAFQPMPGSEAVAVGARLAEPMADVRFVRFVFPKTTLSVEATLTELTIELDPGKGDDDSNIMWDLPLFVDISPGECPNIVRQGNASLLSVAVLGSALFDVSAIDLQSIAVNGEIIAPRSFGYADHATPFIGTAPGCHKLGADGQTDLVLEFDTAEVIESLGLKDRRGKAVPVTITGQVTVNSEIRGFLGQDFLRLQPTLPPLLLLFEDQDVR